MQVVFSNQKLPDSQTKSIFLAGPSPRAGEIADWRPQALRLLESLGFDGMVFIPIPSYRFDKNTFSADAPSWSYDGQVAWEVAARRRADVIAFWVPRTIDRSRSDLGMPAFTTNFEFAEDLATGRALYGRPPEAVKCAYLDERAVAHGLTVHTTLEALVEQCVQAAGPGALREGAEVNVPLEIWRTENFQQWYASLKAAGNRLDDARVVGTARSTSGFLFMFTLWVKVWVTKEHRHKANEVIISRKDASAVFAFARTGAGVQVALVKEFRSPVNNLEGFVFELPGGSSPKPAQDARVCASEELHEETGLNLLEPTRFVEVGARQLAATFSTHRAHVFAVELTEDELAELKQSQAEAKTFSENPLADSAEMTYVQVTSLAKLFNLPVDYSTLGMVFECAMKLGLVKTS